MGAETKGAESGKKRWSHRRSGYSRRNPLKISDVQERRTTLHQAAAIAEKRFFGFSRAHVVTELGHPMQVSFKWADGTILRRGKEFPIRYKNFQVVYEGPPVTDAKEQNLIDQDRAAASKYLNRVRRGEGRLDAVMNY